MVVIVPDRASARVNASTSFAVYVGVHGEGVTEVGPLKLFMIGRARFS